MIHGYRNIDENGRGVDAWYNVLHGGEQDRDKYVIDIYMDSGKGAFKAVSAMEETYEGMLECLRDNAERLLKRQHVRTLKEAVKWAQGMLLAVQSGAYKAHDPGYCEYGDWDVEEDDDDIDNDIDDDIDDDIYDDLYDELDGYGGEGAE